MIWIDSKTVCSFLSAADAIHPSGSVCVTLCKGQGGTPMDQPIRLWADSWQVVAMATYADLVLCKVEPFDAHLYSAYSATGYRWDVVYNNKYNLYFSQCNSVTLFVERNGSGVELRILDYENPGSNPVLRC